MGRGLAVQKQTILEVVQAMPDDVDLDDLLNGLYVLSQTEEGERSLMEEGSISHEEVKQRFRV
jgi:hypothetical protein